MNKIKIAILATYTGILDRGAETFVIELTKHLRNDFNVTVFSQGISVEIKEQTVKVDVNSCRLLDIHKKLYGRIRAYKKICDRIYYLIPSEIEQFLFSRKVYREYLLKEKYDLIFPNNGLQGVRYAAKIRRLNSTPFIYTGHGGNSEGEVFILNQKPDLYVALTERYLRRAKQHYEKVVKIHNGIDMRRFMNFNFVPEKEHETLSQPVVLCAGAFTGMKRQRLLIDAMSFLNNGFLILLGDGEDRQNLEKYCGEKIPGRYLISKVGREEIIYYYYLCDVFSLPSKDEPFGIVYLEAMACNRPVVATRDEDREEIIGNSGILCDVESPEIYAKSIMECYSRNWGSIPEERAINNFSWDKIVKVYEKVIGEITSSSINKTT